MIHSRMARHYVHVTREYINGNMTLDGQSQHLQTFARFCDNHRLNPYTVMMLIQASTAKKKYWEQHQPLQSDPIVQAQRREVEKWALAAGFASVDQDSGLMPWCKLASGPEVMLPGTECYT